MVENVRRTNANAVKQCINCKMHKILDCFYKANIYADGYDSRCKPCRQEVKAKYRKSIKGKKKIKETSALPKYVAERILYSQTHKVERNEYEKKKRSTDPQYKLKHSVRVRTNNFLRGKGLKKHIKTVKLLGCTWKYLIEHLQAQFKPGMTLDNHGIDGWHIDHIKPLDVFDLSNPIEYAKAFHYTNLQPLWAADNIRKKNKY